MAKTSRRVVAIGLVALGLAGTTPAAFGAEPELPAIRILVNTVPGVPIDVLLRAKAETARIYADAGVRLVWSDPSRTLPRLTVMIVSNPDAWRERVGSEYVGRSARDGRRDGETGLCVLRSHRGHRTAVSDRCREVAWARHGARAWPHSAGGRLAFAHGNHERSLGSVSDGIRRREFFEVHESSRPNRFGNQSET